jgi:N-acetylglucosaminyldiphosphoundecaprenol N-acetyl-beta-D-mannosaminyltransferase
MDARVAGARFAVDHFEQGNKTTTDFGRNVYCLLGVPLDAVTMAAVIARVHEAAAADARLLISTPNLNFIIGCRSDPLFRDSIITSDLSTADGMPLVWLSKLLNIPIHERVAGAGLFEALRNDAAKRLSVYFFGGRDGVAERACKLLNLAASPGVQCAGCESPGFGTLEEMSGDEAIARINASGADFLVVSLGAKKGQAWIERNRSRISVPVISHLGAVLNFAAGTVKRAPRWMQQAGLEWLWRIKEEPSLWQRYLSDGVALLQLVLLRVLPGFFFMRLHQPSAHELGAARVELNDRPGEVVLRLQGAWTQENLEPLRECFAGLAAAD